MRPRNVVGIDRGEQLGILGARLWMNASAIDFLSASILFSTINKDGGSSTCTAMVGHSRRIRQ
jgi:hypothetical protein